MQLWAPIQSWLEVEEVGNAAFQRVVSGLDTDRDYQTYMAIRTACNAEDASNNERFSVSSDFGSLRCVQISAASQAFGPSQRLDSKRK